MSENKPSCFSIEHGLKRSCKFCKWYSECKKVFWDKIAVDGKYPEPIETHIDDELI